MSSLPIAFRSPEIESLLSGRLNFFRRFAAGALQKVETGDTLWLREPFQLTTCYDKFKPTSARDLGAKPIFQFEPRPRLGQPLGKVQPARFLCREWHRFHLLVTAVRNERLCEITDEEIALAGYKSRTNYAANWDEGISIRGNGARWQDNPTVRRFEFVLIREPLPKPSKPIPKKRGPKPAPHQPPIDAVAHAQTKAESHSRAQANMAEESQAFAVRRKRAQKVGGAGEPIALPPREIRTITTQTSHRGFPTQAEALAGTCASCATRLTYGCEHHPLEIEAAE